MIKFLRWLFGISFIITGIVIIATTVAGSILLLLAGLLLLPPTFTFLSLKTGKTFGKPVKYASVILLYAIGISLLVRGQGAEVAVKAQQDVEKKEQEQLAFEKLPAAVRDSITKAKADVEKRAQELTLWQDSLKRTQEARTAANEAKKGRKEKVDAQFSAYDGSHHGIERTIKQRMNDPDSYEHVSTRFIDKGDYIAVMTQFRGKNAFGGKVLNSAVAKVDFEGNVLSLEML